MIEQQQRHQAQLLQHAMEALQRSDGACQLSTGIELPVDNIHEQSELERKLLDDETTAQLVSEDAPFKTYI